MVACVLIADDDGIQRQMVEAMVRRCGYEAIAVGNGDAALATLAERPVDALLLDLVMPGLDGMGVLARMRDSGIDIPVIVQIAQGGIDAVSAAMRAGAHDFIIKPTEFARLQVSLRNAIATTALRDEVRRIRHRREGRLSFTDMIARSAAMENVVRGARKAASSTIPALIEGERGTGKQLLARVIHGSGERSARPFVTVDCAAMAGRHIESLLFSPSGKFIEATGGTLFLDQVDALSQDAQHALLRVLQQGEFVPVGARKPVRIDVRIISATHHNLLDLVKAGLFREDLFYRLHVLPLTLPPLRARLEDIPHLTRHFLARICAEEKRNITGVSAAAMAMAMQADWPDNIRQLETTLHRAVLRSSGGDLQISDFAMGDDEANYRNMTAEAITLAPVMTQPVIVVPGGDIPVAPAMPSQQQGMLPMLSESGDMLPLQHLETEIIRFAIQHHRGQMSEVARRLKIGRSTLYRKLETDLADVHAPKSGGD